LEPFAVGNLWELSIDHGVWGKFAYNYTREIGKCINDFENMGINDGSKISIDEGLMDGKYEHDWVTKEFCQESCDNEANCYAFQIGYKSCFLFPEGHWRGDWKTYTTKKRSKADYEQVYHCYTNERNLEQCSGTNCNGYRGF
jgi:hypothetical protein